jgi:hypothetical protein
MPLNNFAPRFGFAYSYTPNTVIRSGYGISYTQYNRAGGENNLTYNGPNVVNATVNNPTPTAANRCINDTQSQLTCFRQTLQGFAASLVSPAAFNPALVRRVISLRIPTGTFQSYFFDQQQPGWL